MTVAVIFGTIEGQTAKIARFVADQARGLGHDVQVVDANEAEEVSLGEISHVVLAAPVHERRHPPRFEAFLTAHRDALEACDTLMLSVSLKAAFPDGQAEAADYLSEMQMRTGVVADRDVLVAGAVRAGAYGYFETEVLRHVVLEGQDFSPEDGPHEFTDWDALVPVVRAFLGPNVAAGAKMC